MALGAAVWLSLSATPPRALPIPPAIAADHARRVEQDDEAERHDDERQPGLGGERQAGGPLAGRAPGEARRLGRSRLDPARLHAAGARGSGPHLGGSSAPARHSGHCRRSIGGAARRGRPTDPADASRAGPLYSGVVRARLVACAETRVRVQARDPKQPRATGRPGFGVPPIARVSPTAPPAPAGYPALPQMNRSGFGLPNLRRNVCPHFYMTGARGAIPIQAPAPAEGADPPGPERVALPAARRRPPRAGLRQRRLPDAALQPVRLLRGRALPRVTVRPSMGDLTHEAASRQLAGARPVRDPARARAGRGRSCASSAIRSSRSAARWSPAPTARAASWRWSARALRAAGLRVGETPKPHLVTLSRADARSTAGRSIRPTFARLVERGPAGRRPGGPAPRRPDRVRAADGGRLPLVRRRGRRPGRRRGRPRRPARRDPRLGRRRGGDHERRPRPHGPARIDGHR